jgi:hypothetical protein
MAAVFLQKNMRNLGHLNREKGRNSRVAVAALEQIN